MKAEAMFSKFEGLHKEQRGLDEDDRVYVLPNAGQHARFQISYPACCSERRGGEGKQWFLTENICRPQSLKSLSGHQGTLFPKRAQWRHPGTRTSYVQERPSQFTSKQFNETRNWAVRQQGDVTETYRGSPLAWKPWSFKTGLEEGTNCGGLFQLIGWFLKFDYLHLLRGVGMWVLCADVRGEPVHSFHRVSPGGQTPVISFGSKCYSLRHLHGSTLAILKKYTLSSCRQAQVLVHCFVYVRRPKHLWYMTLVDFVFEKALNPQNKTTCPILMCV